MNLIEYVLIVVFLLTGELLYLRAARHFGIVDIPNERSLHTDQTIVRGGGIVLWLAAAVSVVYSDFEPTYFFVGLSLVALVSFLDDIRGVAWQYRIYAQFVAVSLLMYQTTNLLPTLWVILLLVVGVGILNAFNFMDGSNGMTAFYSLITIGTIWYGQSLYATASLLLPLTFAALLIFSWFNARQQAICFAGDVGSVSIGFICLYVLIEFIKASESYLPVLFLAVYGIDSVLTIGYRLYLGQNIVQAHRLHLFQRIVYEQQWLHLLVAALYAFVQLVINGLVFYALDWSLSAQWVLAVGLLLVLASGYGLASQRLTKAQKKSRLSKADSVMLS